MARKKTETPEEPVSTIEKDWQEIGSLRIRRKTDGRIQLQILDARPSVTLTAEQFAEVASF